MKTPFIRLIISSSLLLFYIVIVGGCERRDSKTERSEVSPSEDAAVAGQAHDELQERIAHRGVTLLATRYRTTAVVRHRMAVALDDYEILREAMESNDIRKADDAANWIQNAVKNVPSNDLRDRGKQAWVQHAALYNQVLDGLKSADTLSEKRSYFAHLSEIMYCTVKSFGLGADLSNVYYCPMALEGHGAYWLTESKAERNPYFGTTMIGCVQKTETLGP